MQEWDRNKIKKAEDELESFKAQYQKYAESRDGKERKHYEMGIKLRQEDLEFLKKYFSNPIEKSK